MGRWPCKQLLYGPYSWAQVSPYPYWQLVAEGPVAPEEGLQSFPPSKVLEKAACSVLLGLVTLWRPARLLPAPSLDSRPAGL